MSTSSTIALMSVLLASPCAWAAQDWCELIFRKVVTSSLEEMGHVGACYKPDVDESGQLVLVPKNACPESYELVVHFVRRGEAPDSLLVRFGWVEDERELTAGQLRTLNAALAEAREVYAEPLENLRRPGCGPESDVRFCERIAKRVEEALASIESARLSWSAIERENGLLDVYFELDLEGVPSAYMTDEPALVFMNLPDLGITPVTVEWKR